MFVQVRGENKGSPVLGDHVMKAYVSVEQNCVYFQKFSEES
jgi:hypothetical protein